MHQKLILNECPRDAMQGLPHFVPTDLKVDYHNALLKVGFSRLDFGSFVSPKAIPQMRDTGELIHRLDMEGTQTRLLAIVANGRGATQALEFREIGFLGFPLSVSETFQKRNTGKSIAEALDDVADIQNQCLRAGRELLVYLSMAFGNPYGEVYSPELVLEKGQALLNMGIHHLALADTIGKASPAEVGWLFRSVAQPWQEVEVSAHLHAKPDRVKEKVQAAWDAGCRQFDVALGGYGGCPMAEDDLVGNLPTESVLEWAGESGIATDLNQEALLKALMLMPRIFSPVS